MTNIRKPEPPPIHLHDPVHDRDIDRYEATVTSICRPTESLLRFTARIPGANSHPGWLRPNVAIRFYLDQRYGGHTRVYTVRHYDPATESIVVDVVQHNDPSVMMRWSREVRVGDRLTLTGPRVHFGIPTTARSLGHRALMLADATAIPAVVSILAQWDLDMTGEVWVLANDTVAVEEIGAPAGIVISHVRPSDVPAVKPLTYLAMRVREPEHFAWWAAGERADMQALRRYLRTEQGLKREQVAVAGYWRQGVTNADIDRARKDLYDRILADGGDLQDFDDLTASL